MIVDALAGLRTVNATAKIENSAAYISLDAVYEDISPVAGTRFNK
jgi:hypothetical protein